MRHLEAPDDGLDLRLVGFAAGAWGAAFAALSLGGVVGVAIAVGSAVGALAIVSTQRRWRASGPLGWTVVGALLGLFCGAAATVPRLAAIDTELFVDLAKRHVEVDVVAELRDDPRPARGGGPRTTYVVPVILRSLAWPEGRYDGEVRLLVLGTDAGWRGKLPGEVVRFQGRVGLPNSGGLTAAVLSVPDAPTTIEPPPWYQRIAGSLRLGLQRACAALPPEPGGLLPGLVVGDTSRLDPALEEDFRTSGLTHLTAVSGSNCAIVMGAVLLLARWLRAGPRLAAALSVAGLVGFVILARPSPSVLRAAAMGALALVALASSRAKAAFPALCASVVVLLVIDPELAPDAGFALSVLATGALLVLAPRWRDAMRRRRVPPGVAEALAVPAAAQVACAPVIAGISGTISLVAVPANLVAAPAVAPATVLGVVAALVSPVWPDGAAYVAWLGQWPAWLLVVVAHTGADTPGASLPWLSGAIGALVLAAALLALLVAIRHRTVRRFTAVVMACTVVAALPVRVFASGWPPSGWLVVACDVGQGDALVIPVADGQAVVVDAGPLPSTVDGCLERLGITRVVLLVVSHFHADHVGGVAGVFRDRRVDGVVTPAWPDPPDGRRLVRTVAAASGTPVLEVGPDWAYGVGDVRLRVLGPPSRLSGTRSDVNNNSLVLRIEVAGVRVLVTGDAETEEQEALLAIRGPELRAEVLKVAHHGSPFQSPEFLAAVAPRIALVSVGVGNPYGHPSASLLAYLERRGTRVLRTDVDGDVAAVRGESGLAVVVRGSETGVRR